MKNTGVFASKDEIEHLKTLLNTPYMVIGGAAPKNPQIQCHEYALSHGLPEIQGYYGINNDGEFLET